jgi:hypothetical protein
MTPTIVCFVLPSWTDRPRMPASRLNRLCQDRRRAGSLVFIHEQPAEHGRDARDAEAGSRHLRDANQPRRLSVDDQVPILDPHRRQVVDGAQVVSPSEEIVEDPVFVASGSGVDVLDRDNALALVERE